MRIDERVIESTLIMKCPWGLCSLGGEPAAIAVLDAGPIGSGVLGHE